MTSERDARSSACRARRKEEVGTMVSSYQAIGKPTPRVDGAEKVTGQARYAADFTLPDTIWGKTLNCPYSHARIVRIDTTAARQVPGVHAVITGADTRDGA